MLASYRAGVLGKQFFCFHVLFTHAFFRRCQAQKDDLDGELSRFPRTRELTEELVAEQRVSNLWDDFGIIADVVV